MKTALGIIINYNNNKNTALLIIIIFLTYKQAFIFEEIQTWPEFFQAADKRLACKKQAFCDLPDVGTSKV